jgi:hypothetical protein
MVCAGACQAVVVIINYYNSNPGCRILFKLINIVMCTTIMLDFQILRLYLQCSYLIRRRVVKPVENNQSRYSLLVSRLHKATKLPSQASRAFGRGNDWLFSGCRTNFFSRAYAKVGIKPSSKLLLHNVIIPRYYFCLLGIIRAIL